MTISHVRMLYLGRELNRDVPFIRVLDLWEIEM